MKRLQITGADARAWVDSLSPEDWAKRHPLEAAACYLAGAEAQIALLFPAAKETPKRGETDTLLAAAQLAYGALSGQLGNPGGQHARIAEHLRAAIAQAQEVRP